MAALRPAEVPPAKAVAPVDDVDDDAGLDSVQGWIAVSGACVCAFASLGYFYSFAVFVVPLATRLQTGRGEVSAIYSAM